MVLGLPANNAETGLAARLDASLHDPDEHRARTRHLLHLGLLDELNTTPARMPGDQRPVNYQLSDPEPQQ